MISMSIQIAPELETQLQSAAAREGVSLDEIAARALQEWLEDARDIAVAEERLATTDPSQWRTLDELRAAIRGPQNAP